MTTPTSYTITCHRPLNYGAALQAYALNAKLRSYGLDAKVIDYQPAYYYASNKGLLVRFLRVFLRAPEWMLGRRRFGNFLRKYVPMSPKAYRTIEDLRSDVPVADVYIAGSDQIWNCLDLENGKDDTFFLTFAPAGSKKISYAASLAMPEIPADQVERYRKNLSSFDAISVREKTGRRLLTEAGVADVHTVVDPVFLLSRQDWEQLAAEDSYKPSEKYVLVYSFNRNKKLHRYARNLAKSLGAQVYSINTTIEDFFLDTDKYFWNATPNTFVNLIRNAEAVVTNSFHGTSFSIIFNKQFHLFSKKDKANSRMHDLLDELGLLDRFVKSEDLIEESIDYETVNGIVAIKRKASEDFLLKSLRGLLRS